MNERECGILFADLIIHKGQSNLYFMVQLLKTIRLGQDQG